MSRTYERKALPVPSSRLSRLAKLGGLASSIAGNVAGEAARHLAHGRRPRLGDLLLDPLPETVKSRTLVSSVAAAEIRASDLGERAIAVGAATMVLKAALEDSRLFPAVEGGAPGRPQAAVS